MSSASLAGCLLRSERVAGVVVVDLEEDIIAVTKQCRFCEMKMKCEECQAKTNQVSLKF